MASATRRAKVSTVAAKAAEKKPNIYDDLPSFVLLVLLYVLQGIPMGLAMSVPVLLKESGMGFGAKAVFTNVTWPYSLKMLWAPLVDALYVPSWGRRKTWVVPIQLLVGVLMLGGGSFMDELLKPTSMGDVYLLTAVFFVMYLLVATQDIAVDGWALTMLQPHNVGYASVANTVGQTAGSLASYTLLLALTAPGSASWLGAASKDPIMTSGQFVQIWGGVFIVVTLLLAVFKREKGVAEVAAAHQEHMQQTAHAASADSNVGVAVSQADAAAAVGSMGLRLRNSSDSASEDEEVASDSVALLPAAHNHKAKRSRSAPRTRRGGAKGKRQAPDVADTPSGQGVWATYQDIWRVLQLPAVQGFAVLLLTGKAAFSGFMSGLDLVLMEKGLTRDTLAVVSVVFSVGEVLLSAAFSGIAAGAEPLSVFMRLFPPRMASMGACVLLLLLLPNGAGVEGLSTWWIVAFLGCYAVFKVCNTGMFIAQMAFHNKIADPTIGGTYMTLLNTIANLGWMWVAPVALMAMEWLEKHQCMPPADPPSTGAPGGHPWGFDCSSTAGQQQCTQAAGECIEVTDGFSMVCGITFVMGIVWYVVMAPRAAALQAAPIAAWRAPRPPGNAAA